MVTFCEPSWPIMSHCKGGGFVDEAPLTRFCLLNGCQSVTFVLGRTPEKSIASRSAEKRSVVE